MMLRVFIWIFLGITMGACSKSSQTNQDPFRAEFLTACPLQKPYQSRPKDKVNKYCACIYDKTLNGLTDDEAMTARFYLFGQTGIDVKNRNEFVDREMTVVAETMGTASSAIGAAVKACGRP